LGGSDLSSLGGEEGKTVFGGGGGGVLRTAGRIAMVPLKGFGREGQYSYEGEGLINRWIETSLQGEGRAKSEGKSTSTEQGRKLLGS